MSHHSSTHVCVALKTDLGLGQTQAHGSKSLTTPRQDLTKRPGELLIAAFARHNPKVLALSSIRSVRSRGKGMTFSVTTKVSKASASLAWSVLPASINGTMALIVSGYVASCRADQSFHWPAP